MKSLFDVFIYILSPTVTETTVEKTKTESISETSEVKVTKGNSSKRLSVLERIAKLDKNSNEQTDTYNSKTSSLPRETLGSSDIKGKHILASVTR